MNVQLQTQTVSNDTFNQTTNISDTLVQAEKLIKQQGGRFTLIRRHIYQILLESSYPMGAYDIISQLNGIGSEKPPTVYRALSWLIDHGLVAKIAYNSRYTAIPVGVDSDDIAFVICRECGGTDTVKAPGVSKSLHQSAKSRGFADTQMVLEIIGTCGGHKGETLG